MKRNASLLFLALIIGALAAPLEKTVQANAQPPINVYYRFDHLEALPQPFRDAGAAVLTSIKKEGLNPELYFIELHYGYENASMLSFELWDVRAFPLDLHMNGNPGGQCRTAEYDPAKKVVRIFGWR